MYSGSTINRFSGNLLGAHQKIDRLARKHLERLVPSCQFPGTRAILHFEGHNGPDAIKRKSPAQDEPWHFIQPFDENDRQLIELIKQHYAGLVRALKDADTVRASFEAAWLAHAVVDGLTPAHHYPYEAKLSELSNGRTKDQRTTRLKKVLLPGETMPQQVVNNWKMWGPKGLFINHAGFEWGVAMLLAPTRLRRTAVTTARITDFRRQPLGQWFRDQAQEVARLDLYEPFIKHGWTIPLARRVRRQLAPLLVQDVTLIWYGAALEAGLAS